jgi:hypothetical protein
MGPHWATELDFPKLIDNTRMMYCNVDLKQASDRDKRKDGDEGN